MLIGADTGFFVALAAGHPRATEIWEELEAGNHHLLLSTLTVAELLSYFYRRGDGERAREWLDLVTSQQQLQILPVSVPIAVRSAQYRHSLGLPTVDSVILATFTESNCELVLTTDEHFSVPARQGLIHVELLR